MNTTWMDGQFVLDFYQACLAVLFWLLASLACLGVLATVMFLCLECIPSIRPASRSLKQPGEIGVRV